MAITTLAAIDCGDLVARYVTDGTRVGLHLLPRARQGDVVPHRANLCAEPEIIGLGGAFGEPPGETVDSLIHVHCLGDAAAGGFSQGRTMRASETVAGLRLRDQRVERDADGHVVVTTLESAGHFAVEHRLRWRAGTGAVEVGTVLRNTGAAELTIELLTSFALGGITPFAHADAPGRLVVHRFRSTWSGEGRHVPASVERLHLERSWIGHSVQAERFGQVGSMPVRSWHPAVAVEDTAAGVVWAAQLAWAGSWQIELHRRDDRLDVSGGLADYEFGHWRARVAPGGELRSPAAFLTVVSGGLDEACDRLTALQHAAADRHPASERALPVIFNEWCTTWGDPSHERMVRLADALRDSGARFLVIDAGWFKGEVGNWGTAQGDWVPSAKLFPQGIAATAAAIRERGLIPGLWFEMETCGADSLAARDHAAHQLTRDGRTIVAGGRRFWDFRDPWVVDYLAERVIARLREGGFGYLKVDYNETIGMGCDGDASLGEGLRQHLLGVESFFRRIRRELPELVIENCSSGGHRLEPMMQSLAAMGSFSDAHECREIPIIAANLHRLILPRQSQVWAVLHPGDSDQRLVYSLAAGFLGRLCLSGPVEQLSPAQWTLVRRATALYARCAPVIAHGVSRRHGTAFGPDASYRHARGWQALVRVADDGRQALVVAHAFALDQPGEVAVPLPPGPWRIVETFATGIAMAVDGTDLALRLGESWQGAVALLER